MWSATKDLYLRNILREQKMIIDFRSRPPLGAFTSLSIFPKPTETRTVPFGWHSGLPESVKQRSMDIFVDEMQECGITGCVIWGRAVSHRPEESTTVQDIVSAMNAHPEYFVAGFAGIGVPEPGTIRYWLDVVDDALITNKLAGITVDAQFSYPQAKCDDPRLYPIYQRCSDLGGVLALTVSRGTEPYDNVTMANPEAVDRIAGDFPDLKIVVGHAFWPWVEVGLGVAFRRPNIYLVPDVYLSSGPHGVAMSGYMQWVDAANTFLEDRIIFGSTYPRMGMVEAVNGYLALPFRDEIVKKKVMYDNASRLLGLFGQP